MGEHSWEVCETEVGGRELRCALCDRLLNRNCVDWASAFYSACPGVPTAAEYETLPPATATV